jgi:hypothetical protein
MDSIKVKLFDCFCKKQRLCKKIVAAEAEVAVKQRAVDIVKGQGLSSRCVSWFKDAKKVAAAELLLDYFTGEAMVAFMNARKGENNVAWSWIDKNKLESEPLVYVQDPAMLQNLKHAWSNVGDITVNWIGMNGLVQDPKLGYNLLRISNGHEPTPKYKCEVDDFSIANRSTELRKALYKLDMLNIYAATDASRILIARMTYPQYSKLLGTLSQKHKESSDRIADTMTSIVDDLVERRNTGEAALKAAQESLQVLKDELSELKTEMAKLVSGDSGIEMDMDDLDSVVSFSLLGSD